MVPQPFIISLLLLLVNKYRKVELGGDNSVGENRCASSRLEILKVEIMMDSSYTCGITSTLIKYFKINENSTYTTFYTNSRHKLDLVLFLNKLKEFENNNLSIHGY